MFLFLSYDYVGFIWQESLGQKILRLSQQHVAVGHNYKKIQNNFLNSKQEHLNFPPPQCNNLSESKAIHTLEQGKLLSFYIGITDKK